MSNVYIIHQKKFSMTRKIEKILAEDNIERSRFCENIPMCVFFVLERLVGMQCTRHLYIDVRKLKKVHYFKKIFGRNQLMIAIHIILSNKL